MAPIACDQSGSLGVPDPPALRRPGDSVFSKISPLSSASGRVKVAEEKCALRNNWESGWATHCVARLADSFNELVKSGDVVSSGSNPGSPVSLVEITPLTHFPEGASVPKKHCSSWPSGALAPGFGKVLETQTTVLCKGRRLCLGHWQLDTL